MAEKLARYVGIDLGTSTSALAHVRDDGNPEIVPNSDGERLTPSVVFFDQFEGVKLVGSAAKDGGDPERTVRHIKKHMDDPTHVVNIDGETWTPTEISALFLAKLRKDCSRLIGQIEDVVITVPANF
ncbi:MAG: Hsp70 family protein, partial [Verrucomicrobiota bacterium]